MSDNVIVFLTEEYGYRHWLWHTGMTPDALTEWWQNLESVAPYFFSPEGLPGECELLEGTERVVEESGHRVAAGYWSGHIHQDDDSCISRPDGTTIVHAGFGRGE